MVDEPINIEGQQKHVDQADGILRDEEAGYNPAPTSGNPAPTLGGPQKSDAVATAASQVQRVVDAGHAGPPAKVANIALPVDATVASSPAVVVTAATVANSKPNNDPTKAKAAAANVKLQGLKDAIMAGNIPQLVLSVISYALDMRSSDIHMEPYENTVIIRYRVDGILRKIVEYPNNIHPAVVSRIKIMSNLKIDEQRMPQDGRTEVTTEDGREMDLRVSTLPTTRGEKVVMRIQDKSRDIPTLEKLGISGSSLQFINEALEMPNGIVLTTGPTGSGKTTTLYAALMILNKPEVNILTIEDPVEIELPGLNQSQVHPDIDYTFASGLRTALRQDPDIIMVGEIRDHETINIAIEASLTGHLVFSTIHTNSAVETLTRIMNMDIEPFLIVATVNIIIAQRLVRKICQKCKVEDKPDESILTTVKKSLDKLSDNEKKNYDAKLFDDMKFYKGGGCDECNGVGFYGRVGLFEVMKMSQGVKKAILEKGNTLEIEEQAIADGMVTLEQAGIIQALQGQTTLSEVYRVSRVTGS